MRAWWFCRLPRAGLGAFLLGTLAPSVRERDTFAGMIAGLIVMTVVCGTTGGVHVGRPDRRVHHVRLRAALAHRFGSANRGGMTSKTSVRGAGSSDPALPSVAPILHRAIAARVFPGAVVEVGRTSGALATIVAGTQTYDASSPAIDTRTIYDLASLTKVVATAPLIADELASGRMRLDDRVRRWIASWTGEDRQAVTIQDLLEHASGLPGHRPYYESRRGRASFELAICEEPLAYLPRTQSIYSDPGFMLLGFALENAAGAPIDRQFDAWRNASSAPTSSCAIDRAAEWRERTRREHAGWRRAARRRAR